MEAEMQLVKRDKQPGSGGFTRNLVLYLFLVPGLLYMLFFCYIPMLGSILAFLNVRTFKKSFIDTILKAKWAGLKNFEFLFNTPDAFLITRNTILYNVVFIVLGLIASITVAIAVHEVSGKRLAKIFHTTYFLPYFLSWVIVSYLVFSILSGDYGLLNQVLERLGIEPVMWYNSPEYWPGIFVIVNLWKYTGYNSVIYLAAITAIDPEYFEAALMDGASKWQQIKSITLPLIVPMIIILTIMAVGRIFMSDWGMFWNVPLSSGPLMEVSSTIDVYVYRALTVNNTGLSMSAAAGFYQSVVGFVLVLSTNLIVRKVDKGYALF